MADRHLDDEGRVILDALENDHAARAQAIVNCGMCNDDGYRGLTVCDHVDHEPAAKRGRELIQAELDRIRQRKVAEARGVDE